MNTDQTKDEKLQNAKAPSNTRCFKCSSADMVCRSRELMRTEEGNDDMLFIFECQWCGKSQAYWQDGKEWDYTTHCPECGSRLQHVATRKDEVITAQYACPRCDYAKTDTMDFSMPAS